MTRDETQIETDDVFEGLSEPHLATFTGRIPFLLGIPDHLGHTISFPHPFVDPDAAKEYGPHPTVDIRVFTFKTPGIPAQTPGAAAALKHFYNYDLPQDTPKRFGEDGLADYEQWVTLSTQGAIAAGEEPEDKAYTFHRALNVFNVFIEAVMVATQDFRLRTVVAHDFRPAIVIGAITLRNRRWQHLTDMMMFPDSPQRQAMWLSSPFGGDSSVRESDLDAGAAEVDHCDQRVG